MGIELEKEILFTLERRRHSGFLLGLPAVPYSLPIQWAKI